ncbi:Hpt domain-containing protein [Alteraurantiacibacter palmitatis]|uniref:Hpt domain-containing protein n=1 Tax=Alteraurantiacibacter palmitatis TaxID=2054628 RepID=A0ABV7E3E0_9SPHN
MNHDKGDFEANLAAAAGNDPALAAELRACFIDSLDNQRDLLARARCDGNWEVSALRLRSLGASFHAHELIALAAEALESAPGDPVVLRKLAAFSQSLKEQV